MLRPESYLYSHSQLRLVHRHRLLITHHAYKCVNQSEGCNSYELYIHSATQKSRELARVTNNRSTRKTSLVTETVVNERTNLLTCQLEPIRVVVSAGRGRHTTLQWGSILSGVGFSERPLAKGTKTHIRRDTKSNVQKPSDLVRKGWSRVQAPIQTQCSPNSPLMACLLRSTAEVIERTYQVEHTAITAQVRNDFYISPPWPARGIK
jgi:hypothetical protein